MNYFHLSANKITTVRFDVQIKKAISEICI